MVKLTKEIFYQQFKNIKNQFILSLKLFDLLEYEECLKIMEKFHFSEEKIFLPFKEVVKPIRESLTSDKKSFNYLKNEFQKNQFKVTCINLCELFKGYGQVYDIVKGKNWLIFLMNLRNSLGHGVNAEWDVNTYKTDEIYYIRVSDNKKIVIDEGLNDENMMYHHIGGLVTLCDMVVFLDKEIQDNILNKIVED
ncbi:MAG: hypothetical protein NTU97_02310 [Candidatus Magasanikbacteria bacterium]|nr:hypothetical protein [Candidatus Magasanikbacteria bacterium]